MPQAFRQSMLVQVTLLTLLFLGIFIYFVVVTPILNSIENSESAPPEATLKGTFSNIKFILDRSLNSDSTADDIEQLMASEYIQQVIESNPQLSFSFQFKHFDFTINEGSELLITKYEPGLVVESDARGNPDFCTTIDDVSPSANPAEVIYFSGYYCDDTLFLLEISGLTVPYQQSQNPRELVPEWVWDAGKNLVYAMLGVLAIIIVVLSFNFWFISRVTKVAKSFDPNHLSEPLPTSGLPAEMLPLVEAINDMIQKVSDVHEKHDFFLSTAAHEMRTPLTILRSRLAILENSDTKTHLESDIDRIIELVNQLLRLMRVQNEELTDNINVVKCCQDVVSFMEPALQQKGINLKIHSPKQVQTLLGNESLLKVAVSNLIDNAMSFSKSGDTITVVVEYPSKITIKDEGPGIAPDKVDKIFNAFAKYPPNRRNHSGLGLAIVKAIVEMHKGEITAENRAEHGAKFVIEFSNDIEITM